MNCTFTATDTPGVVQCSSCHQRMNTKSPPDQCFAKCSKPTGKPIPRILHLAIGFEPSMRYAHRAAEWTRFNPDWEIRLHSPNSDVMEEYREEYDASTDDRKAELMGLSVLRTHGGVWASLEWLCHGSLDKISSVPIRPGETWTAPQDCVPSPAIRGGDLLACHPGTVPDPERAKIFPPALFFFNHDAQPIAVREDQESLMLPKEQKKAENRIFPKTWAVGITTAPRTENNLRRTLESLSKAGWSDVRIFADAPNPEIQNHKGKPAVHDIPEGYAVSHRADWCGAWPNFLMGLHELYQRNPDADVFYVVQDDMVFSRNAREYIETIGIPQNGISSIYAPKGAERPGKTGFHKTSKDRRGIGACTYLIPNRIAQMLLSDRGILRQVATSSRPSKQIDTKVGQWLIRGKLGEFVHTPALAQHIGDTSALRNGSNTGKRRSVSFAGEDFDSLSLLASRETAAEKPQRQIIGIVGWNIDTKLGQLNRDCCTHLPIDVWLTIRHPKKKSGAQHEDVDTIACTQSVVTAKTRRFLEKIDTLLFVGQPVVEGLLTVARQKGIRTVGIAYPELAKANWVKEVDHLITLDRDTFHDLEKKASSASLVECLTIAEGAEVLADEIRVGGAITGKFTGNKSEGTNAQHSHVTALRQTEPAISRKLAVVAVGDGLGNVIEQTPLINAVASEYETHVWLPKSNRHTMSVIEDMPGIASVSIDWCPEWGKPDAIFSTWLVRVIAQQQKAGAHYAGYAPRGQHEAIACLGAAANAGISGDPEARYCGWDDYRDPLPADRPYIGVTTGRLNRPVWKLKEYRRYREVVDRILTAEPDAMVIHFGIPSDPDIDHPAVEDYRHHDFSLRIQLGLIRQCSAFFGNDTGLGHCAAALGVPTTVVFGPTCETKNLPTEAKAVSLGLPCQPCQFGKMGFRDGKKCGHECMTDLPPERVAEAVIESLGRVKV